MRVPDLGQHLDHVVVRLPDRVEVAVETVQVDAGSAGEHRGHPLTTPGGTERLEVVDGLDLPATSGSARQIPFLEVTRNESRALLAEAQQTVIARLSQSGFQVGEVSVEANRGQLSEIVRRVRKGRLRTHIGTVATLDDAVAAFNPAQRRPGKTIIRIRS